MPTPSELHFEGAGPRNRWRWVVLAAVAVLILLGFFVQSTLPTQRPELIGRWQDTARKDCYYELRADGTYTAVVPEDWLAMAPNPRGHHQGRWKASADALYLVHEKIEFTGDPKFRKAFDESVKERVGRYERLPIEWPSENQWRMIYHHGQTFQKAVPAMHK